MAAGRDSLTLVHHPLAHLTPRNSRPRPRAIHRCALERQRPLGIARLIARLESLHPVQVRRIKERDDILDVVVELECASVGLITRAVRRRGVGHVDDDGVSAESGLVAVGRDVAAEERRASVEALGNEGVGRLGDAREGGEIGRVVASALGGGEEGGTVGPF